MKTVTTIPTAYTDLEETRESVKQDVYDFLAKIANKSEEHVEAKIKEEEIYKKLSVLIPKDKLALLIEYSDINSEIAWLEEKALIDYLINHGDDLKKAIVNF